MVFTASKNQREGIMFQLKWWNKTLLRARESRHPALISACEKNIENLVETKSVIDHVMPPSVFMFKNTSLPDWYKTLHGKI